VLAEAGDAEGAERARREADAYSWSTDPWLVLEAAWRELPPPRTDVIEVGRGDYGAVRGFFHPRGSDPALEARYRNWNQYRTPGPVPPPGVHRWSRHRAWLRLVPTQAAPAYRVTLTMGSPFPSPLHSPEVEVQVLGGAASRFVLGPELRDYNLVTPRPADGVLVVRLDAPTWCLSGEPAEQGVRVEKLTVTPAP
jgi:hypothetical protein